jgi:hypothetical protein
MKKTLYLIVFILITAVHSFGQDPKDTTKNTFSIFLSAEACDVELDHVHAYTETIDTKKGVRIIDANGIPSHKTGKFPNQGNPNTIAPQSAHYEIPLLPTRSKEKISSKGKRIGILFSGVEVDPFTNEFFQGKKGANREWNITTLTSTYDLGLDCNNAHVQPGGKYHYHGTPNAYLDDLGVDGSGMIKIGYAADGYPIYYKFGYNTNGEIVALESSYGLKEGHRPGDGKKAPDGVYDGTYFQDYEYKEALSELDECNGIIGKTPESESEYYYVITDNFPSSPLCFSAEPSKDFANQGMPGGNGRLGMGQRPGNDRGAHDQPDPSEILRQLDTNGDGQISKAEAKGPMIDHFDQIDKNGDGFVTKQELQNAGPPR